MEKEKKKKKGGIIGWIILLLFFTAAGYLVKMNLPSLGHETIIDTKTLKSELVAINELATYQKEYRETIVKDKKGFFSKRYYATYDGVIRAGINMENVNVEVDQPDDSKEPVKIEVTLPDAEILDHTDDNWTVVYEDGYQNKDIGNERNTVIKDRKKEVEEKFKEEGGLDEASKKAKEVIEDFIKTSYGDDVVVEFEED